jgi:hypothetical protein
VIMFMVRVKLPRPGWLGPLVMFTTATGREEAKRSAFPVLSHSPDLYEVTPLTNPGEVFVASIVTGS